MMLMNLYVKAKTSEMVTVICGINNIYVLSPRFLVFLHVESHHGHRKPVKNVINTLFSGASEEEMAVTLDLFCTEYTAFYQMIGSYNADEFIWNSKDISDRNSHLWHQKYSLPFTTVLGFVACIVTSKVLGIGAAERS